MKPQNQAMHVMREPRGQIILRRTFIVVTFCFFAQLSTSVAVEQEYVIKAEFLERFTRFIEWPGQSNLSERSSPFFLCVIGENPYGSYLQYLADSTKVKKKRMIIREIWTPQEIGPCNLLFISSSEKTRLAFILSYTSGRPILTIGDSPGFAERGVLINFYEYQRFVRFAINTEAVDKSGLKFSSRLLKLGRLVRTTTAKR